MKFCAIGCGGHATDTHGPSQQKIAAQYKDIELSACCDLDENRARSYQKRFGFARHYRNIETMLECEQPDAVSLVVPTHAACTLAVPILRKGIPLFLEKPPGLNLAEFEKMARAALQGKGINQVAFNRRYMSVIAQARAILETEMLPNEVLQINYDMIRHERRDPDFSTTAVHAIDAVSYLARSLYQEVKIDYCELPELGSGVAAFTMEGDCESGTRFRLNFQPVAGVTAEKCSIHGIGQTLKVDLLFGGADQLNGTLEHWKGDRLSLRGQASGDLHERNGTHAETLAFFEAVKAAGSPTPTLEECRQQIILMEAIRTRTKSISFKHGNFDARTDGACHRGASPGLPAVGRSEVPILN